MTPPYKKRRFFNKSNDSSRENGSVKIDVGDGAAIPRPNDPGLVSAWKISLALTIVLLMSFTFRQDLAIFLLKILPESLSNQKQPFFFLQLWAQDAVAFNQNFAKEFLNILPPFLSEGDKSFSFLHAWSAKPGIFYEAINVMFPDGVIVTFKVTFGGIGVALVFGFITGLGRVSKNRLFSTLASIYVEVVRGIPLLVQLFFIYYALPFIINVSEMWSAILALGFCYGAYMGEVIRSSIEAIDRGQQEAAMSLGLSHREAMLYVILPQAMRTILPPVGNEFIALLKDSSLVSIVALADITRKVREFVAPTFSYVESFFMLALVYLLMTLILSKLVSIMELKLSHYERR